MPFLLAGQFPFSDKLPLQLGESHLNAQDEAVRSSARRVSSEERKILGKVIDLRLAHCSMGYSPMRFPVNYQNEGFEVLSNCGKSEVP